MTFVKVSQNGGYPNHPVIQDEIDLVLKQP